MNEPLKSYEIKILKMIHKIFGGSVPYFVPFKKEMEKLGLDIEEISDFFRLYVNNYKENGDYENIKEPNRGDLPLITTIKEIIKNRMPYDDLMEKLNRPEVLGNWFNPSTFWQEPKIDADNDGLYLHMDNEEWEKYFSGLDENDIWYYNRVQSYGDNYEEMNSDEFRYALGSYPKEYRENIATLAKMVGDIGFADTIMKSEEEEGQFYDFLEKYFPSEADDIARDYLNELGYVTYEVRKNGVEECYEDNVKFKSGGNSNAEIFMPWRELLKFILENENVVTISDLKDAQINGDGMDLESCWYETYPRTEDYKEPWESIDKNVRKLIEKMEEGDYGEEVISRVKVAQDMWDIVNKLGFKKDGKFYSKITPNKIKITIESFNTEKGKFTITVDYPKKYGTSKWDEGGQRQRHIIDAKDLGTWVTSLPLNRQLENYRNLIKKILKEDTISNKDSIWIKKILNSKMSPVDMWPSEGNGYTWYVEFDSDSIYNWIESKDLDYRESFIYAFNSEGSLSGVDEGDNYGMMEQISEYITDQLGIDYDASIFEIIQDFLEKQSIEYIKSQGHDPFDYHLDDI